MLIQETLLISFFFLFRILLKRGEKRRIWLQLLIQNTHNIIPPF